MYQISRCSLNETGDLMRFINIHWKPGHILGNDERLLKWQHLNKISGDYNFYIARNLESGEIDAVLGSIPLAQFDQNLQAKKDYWTAIWKVREDISVQPGLGHLVFVHFERDSSFTTHGVFGITPAAQAYHKMRKYSVSTVSQYYISNPYSEKFVIGVGLRRGNNESKGTVKLQEVQSLSEYAALLPAYVPVKSIEYFQNRYMDHPFYKYRYLEIRDAISGDKYVFVVRKISVQGASCFRIVDIIGKLIPSDVSGVMAEFLESEKAEYIDCLNAGIDEIIWTKAGFHQSYATDTTVLPNYFEPFSPKKTAIYYGVKPSNAEYVVFKGDSDQDRPNQI